MPTSRRFRCSQLAAAALLATSSLSSIPGAHALFGFGDKRFKYEGLINAGGLGLESLAGQIVAWGDWNGDQFLDAIFLDSSRSTLNVHLWNHNQFLFEKIPAASVTLPPGALVTNVIAADLNYDGRLDLLVMSQSSRASTQQQLDLSVYLGLIQGDGFSKDPIPAPASTLSQPISFDASGDMQMDLLGHALDDTSREPILSLWRNILADPNATGTAAFELAESPLSKTDAGIPTCNLASPHSSAYVDLNGDCLADLFLVCSSPNTGDLTYQIWTATKPNSSSEHQKDAGFTLAASGALPPGTGALSFADMDRDGTIDVVFPTCDRSGSNCYINVAYNRQVELCSKKSEGLFGGGIKSASSGNNKRNGPEKRAALRCRDPQELCVADDNFRFNFDIDGNNPDLLRISIETLTGDSRVLLEDKLGPSSAWSMPVSLQLGDYNKDGYPDVALITIPSRKNAGGTNDRNGLDETRVTLLENVACSSLSVPNKPSFGCTRERENEGTFRLVREGAGVLEGLRDVRRVSWVDVDEDGTLDLLLQRVPSTADGKDGSRRMTFIQNNYFHDAFFLKSLTLNGACQIFCEPEDSPKFRPWGTNYGGASYKFTVLDTNGVRRAQQVGQMAQTAYHSLHTPYSYFGLGRTNNYVESLFIGSTRRLAREHVLAVEGIIPNSQVVINPWQADPSAWTKQLYLHPGDWIPWVTVVLITTIVGLAAVVVVLHVNERREDERERKRAVHAINFDAL